MRGVRFVRNIAVLPLILAFAACNKTDSTTAAGSDSAAPAATSPVPNAAAPEAPAPRRRPDKTAIQSKTLTVAVGTELSVRTDEAIDSATAAEGQTFAGEITKNVTDAAGDVVIPEGADAQIVIRSSSKGGKVRGASDLVLDLQSVTVGGQQYLLSTTDLVEQGKNGVGANKRTAEFVGGGAGIGTLIGAIAGKGKGAGIGAASGAGAGALTEILTKGSIKIPAETVMTFKLDKTLRIVEKK